MIKYQLICNENHEFEGWFRDSADYDAQSSDGLVECPVCGGDDVRKAVMAPAVAGTKKTASRAARLAEIRQDVASAMERARNYVENNFDYVGDQFPEEARKIHYGETDERPIYGEATGKDVKELVEEGVEVAPLPGAGKKSAPKAKAKTPAGGKKLN